MSSIPTLYTLSITPSLPSITNYHLEGPKLLVKPIYPLPSHKPLISAYYTVRISSSAQYERRIETRGNASELAHLDHMPRGTVLALITLTQKKLLNEVALSIGACEGRAWILQVLEELEKIRVVEVGTAGRV